MNPLKHQDKCAIFIWFAAAYVASIRVTGSYEMNTIGEGILSTLDLLDHVSMPLVNKGVNYSSVENIGICILVPGRWILMHVVRSVEQFRTTINAELIAFPVLLRLTVPALLIALMVDHLIDVLLSVFTYYLGDLVASNESCPGCQHRKIACCCLSALLGLSALFRLPRLLPLLPLLPLLWLFSLVGWHVCHSFILFLCCSGRALPSRLRSL